MPGERGRSGPSGIPVRIISQRCRNIYCYDNVFLSVIDFKKLRVVVSFWYVYFFSVSVQQSTWFNFVFQGKRGSPGNVGKHGPMVSHHSSCFICGDVLYALLTFWYSLACTLMLRWIWVDIECLNCIFVPFCLVNALFQRLMLIIVLLLV